MKNRIILILLLLLFPVAAQAAEKADLRPHWSLELKGGVFYPDIDNWEAYYGDDKTPHYAGALAYKPLRWFEIGIEGGYVRDKGKGLAPGHTADAGGVPVFAGEVTYEIFPLHVSATVRLIFTEDQWLVPYVGGGWTRIYYLEKVEFQDTVKGYVDGYHGRAGIQLLLDGLDESAANGLFLDYGVHHTYLFFEAQKTTAKVDNTAFDLGGVSFLGGLLFEF